MHQMRDTPPGTENQLDKLLTEHRAAYSEPVNDKASHAANATPHPHSLRL